MIVYPTDRTTSDGRIIQRLANSGKPLFACMYLNGQVQLYDANITEKERPEPSFEGKLVLTDSEGEVIQIRHAFGVIIEEGAHFEGHNELIITDQLKVDEYWDEFVQAIADAGLIMPIN